jgi:hypothetical protein
MPRLFIVIFLLASVPSFAQDEGVVDPPRYHHEDHPEGEHLEHAPSQALAVAEIDAAHQACMEQADELEGAIQCQEATREKYLDALDRAREEVLGILTPAQQGAFDASEAAWQQYIDAEKSFLREYWGDVNPEWGQLMRKESILEMYRFRLETLEQIPRD